MPTRRDGKVLRAGARPHRVVIVGTGGHGRSWCDWILAPFVRSGDVEVVAAVDRNRDALVHARRSLGVGRTHCFTTADAAFGRVPADACIAVMPGRERLPILEAACAAGLDVLVEKPVAVTWSETLAVARLAREHSRKVAVTMNHRFDSDKQAFLHALGSRSFGSVQSLLMSFATADSSVGLTHMGDVVANPLLVDAAIHHFDILRAAAGAPCDTVFADAWDGSSRDDSFAKALVTVRFTNGVYALYEGSLRNATPRNTWAYEFIRAECERATVELDRRRIRVWRRPDTATEHGWHTAWPRVAAKRDWRRGWFVTIEQFLRWRETGIAMATSIESHLPTAAIAFAAVESSRTGRRIAVRELVEHTRDVALPPRAAGAVA
jgi:predicted dehydrogenase